MVRIAWEFVLDEIDFFCTLHSTHGGSKSIAIVFPIVENAMTYCDVIIHFGTKNAKGKGGGVTPKIENPSIFKYFSILAE